MFRSLTRKRVAAGAALIAALVAAIALLTGGADEESVAEETSATGTAVVERQDLVETEDMDGTLGYADSREVVNRLGGTVTWLPDVGSVVKPGERLFEIDDEPVYLLDGREPAYRALEPGLSGSDVLQLERNLRRLGYDSGSAMTVDGEWDSGTTVAVYSWQEQADLDVTGVIALGRVVFQPGRRRIADRAVSLGDSGAEGGSGAAADTAEDPNAAADTSDGAQTTLAAVAVSAETPTTFVATAAQGDCEPEQESPEEESDTPADADPQACDDQQGQESAPEDEQPQATDPTQSDPAPEQGTQQTQTPTPQASAAEPSSAATSGEEASETAVSATVMTTTTTRRRVTVEMPTDRVDLAKKRARVEVELPSGDEVDGRISSVGRVATLPEGEDVSASDATIDVSIRLSERAGSVLDQAPVTVSFERERAKDVLTVPVTALLAQRGGTFAVEVREGEERRVLPVETGLYTDGLVEISGEGLSEGMTVTDSGL